MGVRRAHKASAALRMASAGLGEHIVTRRIASTNMVQHVTTIRHLWAQTRRPYLDQFLAR